MGCRFQDILGVLRELSDEEIVGVYRYACSRLSSAGRLSDAYISAMNGIIGEDIRRRTRSHGVLWGRYIVINELLDAGWTTSMAGSLFGIDHSTVVNARKQVRNMFAYPQAYAMEMAVYRKFKRRVRDVRVRMEG